MAGLSRRDAACRAALALQPELAYDEKRLEAAVDALLALCEYYERRMTRRRTPRGNRESRSGEIETA